MTADRIINDFCTRYARAMQVPAAAGVGMCEDLRAMAVQDLVAIVRWSPSAARREVAQAIDAIREQGAYRN